MLAYLGLLCNSSLENWHNVPSQVCISSICNLDTWSDRHITTVHFIITFLHNNTTARDECFAPTRHTVTPPAQIFPTWFCTLTCWETAERWWCLSQRWRPRLIAVTLTMLISLPCQKPSDRHKLWHARTEMPESQEREERNGSSCATCDLSCNTGLQRGA